MKSILFRNIAFIKEQGPKFLSNLNYKEIGYEASEAGLFFGGYCWFQAKRDAGPFIYTIQLRKQGDSLKWMYERILNTEAALTNKVID